MGIFTQPTRRKNTSFKDVIVGRRGVWGRKDFFSPQADTQTEWATTCITCFMRPPMVTRAKWTSHGQTEGKKKDAPTHSPFVLRTVLCLGRRLNTTLKKVFMNHWWTIVISSNKKVFQVPNPHHSLLDQMVGNRQSRSSENQLENDGAELNQWSAGRQACYLQDGTT